MKSIPSILKHKEYKRTFVQWPHLDTSVGTVKLLGFYLSIIELAIALAQHFFGRPILNLHNSIGVDIILSIPSKIIAMLLSYVTPSHGSLT